MPSFSDFVKKEPKGEPVQISISCEDCNSPNTDAFETKLGEFSAYCKECGYVTKIVFEWMKNGQV